MRQADPGLLKAQLRSGVSFWRLGMLEDARASFEGLASRPDAPADTAEKLAELQAFQSLSAKVRNPSVLIHLTLDGFPLLMFEFFAKANLSARFA